MFRSIIILAILFALFNQNNCFSKSPKTDANIVGHVTCRGSHVPYVNVRIKGTSYGAATDRTGHYQIINAPAGDFILVVSSVGYKTKEIPVTTEIGKTIEVKIELEEDALNMDEVVVSGARFEQKRSEAPVIVTSINREIVKTTESISVSDGLNFCPGVRIENNCQNCGFNQVRMNGLEGPYSQILVDNRAVFSGLAGVYGLELIPANMIDRIEVVRGGGSALFGGNAIAGTINIILKDPVSDVFEIGVYSGSTGAGADGSGGAASDNNISFNASVNTDDKICGLALYGFYRDRGYFDANDDSLSELSQIKNATIGGRAYHRVGDKGRISTDFFHISEDRRGGDRFDYPLFEANIAEAATHNINSAAIEFDLYMNEDDLLSIYASGLHVDRDSYYGAERSLSAYGKTESFAFSSGATYNFNANSFNIIGGFEFNGENLLDKKLGYPDYDNAVIENGEIVEVPHTSNVTVADQTSLTVGGFAQYEQRFDLLKISAGLRLDNYSIKDDSNGDEKTGSVLSPRVSIMYDIFEYLQARASFSQGYRAPQVFDEDLHIETSGSRQVLHRNAKDLKQETSRSYMFSLDFNKQIDKVFLGVLVEGFYTSLIDPFVNEFGEPDENGLVVYTRKNSDDGATVTGANVEVKLAPTSDFTINSGFTIQTSEYEKAAEFGEKRFFRTPDSYGFLAANWDATKRLTLSLSGAYTGSMLVPYFGTELSNPEEGELRESDPFFDIGAKIAYDIVLNGTTLELFAGAKNIFNSYQDDFDRGIDRDPGYIYGPTAPRTVYFGFKLGNTQI